MKGGGGVAESDRADFVNNFVDIQPNVTKFPKICWRLKFQHHCFIRVSAVSMVTAFLKTVFFSLANNSIFIHFMWF